LGTFIDRETWYHERSKHPGSGFNVSNIPRREIPPVGGIRATSSTKTLAEVEEDYPPSDTEFTGVTLAEGLKELRVAGNPRFLGKSSGMTLVQAAMDFKREYSGNRVEGPDVLGTTISDRRREEFWSIPDVCSFYASPLLLQLITDCSGSPSPSKNIKLHWNFPLKIFSAR
jgi:hypothetical protein